MKAYLSTHLLVALNAVIIAIVIVVSAWYIDYVRSETEQALMQRIELTRTHIIDLADTTDRNGADELTERIIVDCPKRAEFESLLISLGNATKRDLIRAQQLFVSCGAFFSERKAFMVSQLEREYRMLEGDLTLLATLRDLTQKEDEYYGWTSIIELEKKRSALLTEQTAIQGDIISLLIEGGNAARINELVREAQGVAESITAVDIEVDVQRRRLSS